LVLSASPPWRLNIMKAINEVGELDVAKLMAKLTTIREHALRNELDTLNKLELIKFRVGPNNSRFYSLEDKAADLLRGSGGEPDHIMDLCVAPQGETPPCQMPAKDEEAPPEKT
jgi:hypothetical protein